MSGTCNQCSVGYYSGINALSCTACGTGQYQDTVGAASCKACTNKPANASSVVYSSSSGLTSNSCPISSISSCESGYTLSGGACVNDPCLGIPAIGTTCLDNSKYAGQYLGQKMKIMYADGVDRRRTQSSANSACNSLGSGWKLSSVQNTNWGARLTGESKHIFDNSSSIGLTIGSDVRYIYWHSDGATGFGINNGQDYVYLNLFGGATYNFVCIKLY